VCSFALCSGSLSGQTPDTATIHGQSFDPSHAAVSGAQVELRDTLTSLERRAETGPTGEFTLAGLPVAGTYTISVSKAGFVEGQLSGLTLTAGTTAELKFELALAGGATHITVTGVMGEVRADTPQLGIALTADQAEEMPLLDRKITYLPLLNAANRPAINQGDVFMNEDLFTTNGAGRRQTWFEVDGSTGNDSWGRQTIFSNIPLAAIGEMTVLSNAFSAEYGGSTGSVVDIVTASGGSQYHGEGLYVWRPSATEAKLSGFTASSAGSGNDLTNDTLNQGALSASGPLGSGGRTHFAVAGEYSSEDRASPVTSPVEPGSFIGHYRDWLGFLRLDHQINDKNNLFFRSDVDGFYDTNPNGIVGGNSLPSVDRVFKRRTYSEEVGETAVLSPTLLNNVRVQFQLASPITQFEPVIYSTEYTVPISTGGTFSSGTSQSAELLNRQYEATDTLSAVWGVTRSNSAAIPSRRTTGATARNSAVRSILASSLTRRVPWRLPYAKARNISITSPT
jgi:hypothetical protein